MQKPRGRFTPEWIQELKSKINLIDVVAENVDLRKSGSNRFMGRCPFHGDRSPSFSVNHDFYFCFGCKETGDAIKFMTSLHGLSFEEACEDLAEKAGVKIPEGTYQSSAEEQAMYQRRARTQKGARLLHFAALQYYHHNLIKGKTPTAGKLVGETSALFAEATEYLKKRGISGQTIQNFMIGVANSKYEGLSHFLAEKQAPLDLAVELDLIRNSKKNAGEYYDVFRERLMFPFIDVRGRVVGFGGRILPSCDKKDAEVRLAKYYNSSESDLFHKSKFLYGLFQAKRAIREEEVVIVVEGNFDVIAMHQHGFENTVATCGTSLTEDHLKTLGRLAKKIIVFFDQDSAGINATEKAMELGLRNGVLLYGIPYESKLDPDEFLITDLEDSEKPNTKKMKKWIESAYPLLDHRIEHELKSSENNIEDRSIAVKKITAWLESFTDEVGRAMRVDQLVQKWRIPPNALGRLAQYAGRPLTRPTNPQQQGRPTPSYGNPAAPGARPSRRAAFQPYDRQLLQFLVKFEKFGPLFLEAKKQIPEKDSLSAFFDDTELREWVQRISENPSGFTQLKLAPETLLTESISQELQSVIMEGLLQESVAGDEAQLEVLLKKGIHKIWVRFSHELKHQMAAADASQDMEKFKELSQQFLDLQRKLKEFEGSYVSGK